MVVYIMVNPKVLMLTKIPLSKLSHNIFIIDRATTPSGMLHVPFEPLFRRWVLWYFMFQMPFCIWNIIKFWVLRLPFLWIFLNIRHTNIIHLRGGERQRGYTENLSEN